MIYKIEKKKKVNQRKGNSECSVGIGETEKEVRKGLMRM